MHFWSKFGNTDFNCGDLSCRQAQNEVNFDFYVQFDLEVQDQSSQKSIGILTKVFYISGPNLVILAEMVDELSRGQVLHLDQCILIVN